MSERYVFGTQTTKRYRFPTHVNDLVVDRSETHNSEVFVVVLTPGEAPPPHRHDDAEQVFYVLTGHGRLRAGDENHEQDVGPGDVVVIPPSTLHSIEALGTRDLRYLAIDCFTAGPSTDEPTWDAHVRAMCKRQGWDYDAVAASRG